jgi:hypothetical protein
MKIKDTFEIKNDYGTGHAPGLVVVLDTLISEDPDRLVGQLASIWLPSGEILEVLIDEAREHAAVNSLFFRGLRREDIPVDSKIVVALQPESASTKPSRSIAS